MVYVRWLILPSTPPLVRFRSEQSLNGKGSPNPIWNKSLLLRKAGLVNAIRGSYGGYVLSKPPEKITVGEIILALEGPLVSVNCVTAGKDASCDKKETCHTQFFWKKLSDQIMEVLSSTHYRTCSGSLKSCRVRTPGSPTI